MFDTIAIETLSTVTGGLDEASVRSFAASSCPATYAQLKNKPMSKITRADVQPCLDEMNPFKRALATPQVDAFFAHRK